MGLNFWIQIFSVAWLNLRTEKMRPITINPENDRCRGLQVKVIPSFVLEIVDFVAYSDFFSLQHDFHLKP